MSTTTDPELIKQYRENEKRKRAWLQKNDPEWVERQKVNRKRWLKNYKKRKGVDYLLLRQVIGKRYAEKHPFRVLCKKLKHEVTPWELWKLVKRQRLLCALTGEKLTRKNISLDHIIPKKLGGTNSIDNLRFTTLDVNRAKFVQLDPQFIDMCRKVVEWSDSNKQPPQLPTKEVVETV